MAKQTPRDVLKLIAATASVMSELERVPVQEVRPPKVHKDGPRMGTLVLDDNDEPVDVGSPAITLADLVRHVLGEEINHG